MDMKKLTKDMCNVYYDGAYQCTVWCDEDDRPLYIAEFEDPTKVEIVKWEDDNRKRENYLLG
jgi:hypothetical protein